MTFNFKKFSVQQDSATMKVNTDGVLVGAWFTVSSKEDQKILDIGSGTGVIALMAAQRLQENNVSRFRVDAVEIDTPSSAEALCNFISSPWAGHLKMFNAPLNFFADNCPGKYTGIVSNPPYFNNSLKNPSLSKRLARHTDSLSYQEIIVSSKKLLVPGGILSVILPHEESALFISIAEEKGFAVKRMCRVFAKEGDASPKRVMIEFALHPQKANAETSFQDLCIMGPNLEFTPAYKALTGDFYLKF